MVQGVGRPEMAPLLASQMGTGRLTANRVPDGGSGPRRRGGGGGGAENVHHTSFSAPSPVPPSDDEKKDRGRSFVGRIRSGLASARDDGVKGDGGRSETDYYDDKFNDQPWKCSFGTHESDGIWMNREDQPGTIMSFMVWLLIIYSGVTVVLLTKAGHLPPFVAMVYCTICALALASHAKTTYTDPGAVPQAAVPTQDTHGKTTFHTMCSQCQAYKPEGSHHCRICNRCISKMDHHCPWMNNCIGAANMKHFILFLLYTWAGSAFALLVFSHNYFFCSEESCEFSLVLVQLVRAMTFICIGTLAFTSSMIMNVAYGILTGIGTIDRLKKKANDNWSESDEEQIPLMDIFGVAGYHTWPFPVDPFFEDYDRIMGYSMPQRLLRENRDKRDTESESLCSISTRGYSQV